MAPGSRQSVTHIGRYQVLGRIAAGGMGTVHLARQLGDAGFARTVAIKFLHPHLAALPELVARFLDEARVAARIRHPNVVTTIDVVQQDETLCLVMEYVRGESVSALLARAAEEGERIPQPVALRVLVDTLRGLHAAHTAVDDDGVPLSIVHRDVSPQNVLVGLDGAAHLLDFGIAKAAGSLQTTTEGQLKGKLRYMAPEQIVDHEATPRSDIYAASVVLWELLTGRRLFEAANDGALLAKVLEGAVLPPSHFAGGSPELDAVVLRGLARDPAKRAATAEEMARELERIGGLASTAEVTAWVERLAGARLRDREARLSSDVDPARHDAMDLAGSDVATATAPAPPKPVERTALLIGAPMPVATRPASGSRRRAIVLGAAAIALAAIVALAALASRTSRRDEPPTTARALPPPTSASIVAPSASSPPSPASDPSSPPSASAAISSASPTAVRRPASRPPIQRSTKPDCSTPYYQDESGIRRVRRECL